MPNSTYGKGLLGHSDLPPPLGLKDAPTIQHDDNVDISDVYAFTMNGESDAGAAAAVDPMLGSSGIIPEKDGFDAQTGSQLNLSGSEPDTSPVSVSLPDGYSTSVGSSGQNSNDLDKSPEDEADEFYEKLVWDLNLKSSDEINPATSGTIPGDDTLVGDAGNGGLPGDPNNDTISGGHGDDTDVDESRDGTYAKLVKTAELFDLMSVEAAKMFVPPIIEVESESGSANTSLPDGFPNGSRFGDDVVDNALAAIGSAPVSSLRVDTGGFANVPGAASSGGFLPDDILYPINVDETLTETKADPLAGKSNVFDEDDPEYHGDGELIV